jgi:hypothetical protein
MKLVEVTYSPGSVLGRLGPTSWVLPLAASLVIVVLATALMIYAVGFDSIMGVRGPELGAQGANQHATIGEARNTALVATAFGTALKLALVLVFALVIFALLRLSNLGVPYWTVLAVCSYGAYARELLDLSIKAVVVAYHRFTEVPLTNAAIPTDASVFLHAPEGWLRSLIESLDLLTLWYLVVVIFGLTKAVPTLRFYRAALVTASPWLLGTLLKALRNL